MTKLRDLYKKNQAEKLMEARVGLLEKGVYPFDVFLKEHKETIEAASTIELLEQIALSYETAVPTFHLFVKHTSDVLMESKTDPDAVQASMINYAFISEALGKCVKEAVKLLAPKHPSNQPLSQIYGKDAIQLLEFCIQRAEAGKLMEGDTTVVVRNLATELSTLNLEELAKLCESVPAVRLYVSNSTHTELAKIIAG